MKAQSLASSARRIASAPEHYRSLVSDDDNSSRFAVVRNARSVSEVEAYLPSNYTLVESFEEEREGRSPVLVAIIGGYDNAGWTLDGYVIPRYASGLIFAEEIR